MADETSGGHLKDKSIFQLKNRAPKEPNFNFGESSKSKPIAFNSEPLSKALSKKVDELGAKIDAIDERLNNMSSLLSSILKVVTSFEKKDLDTSGCKSAGDCPTLPPKLWTRIFLQLERYELLQVRMTCRSWKQLVDSNSGLREGFAISFPEGSIMDREYLPADLPPASKVTLRKVRIIEVGGWLPSLGNTLVHLCLSDCRMRATMLVDILRQTPKLKILELKSSATILDREEILTEPKLELNELECLVLDEIYLVDFLSFPRLKVLKCTSIWFHKLAAFISSIQTTVHNVELYYQSVFIDSLKTLKHLKLKRLEFIKCFTSSDVIAKLIELCRVQPTIEELLLPKEAIDITCDHLKLIGSYLPRLTFLRAVTVQEIEIPNFLTALPCLKVLDWNTARKVDFSGLSSPNLLKIYLRNQKIDYSLRSYLKHSPNISTIFFEKCHFSDWTAVFDSVNHCKRLRHLELKELQVTYSHESLLEYFDELRSLTLCKLTMPKEVLKILFRLCPQLEVLDLQQMTYVDNEVVELACQKMRKLKRLTLDRCPLTDVPAIEQYRSQLEYLRVENCGEHVGKTPVFSFSNPVPLNK